MRIAVVDLDVLARNWWMILLRGVAGILFGFITFVAPGISLAVLVLLFGAYAIVSGALLVTLSFRLRSLGGTHHHHTAVSAHGVA
jgi:uncharacterized membrane protein HdeD (DUF308 family)